MSRAYSASAGNFTRVFFAETEGWISADALNVTPELIAEHLAEIDDIKRFVAPNSMLEELTRLAERLAPVLKESQSQLQ